MGGGKIKILRDLFLNILIGKRFKLSYIVEAADWSIKADGRYITNALNRQGLIKSRITTSFLGLKNQIIHFGSVNTFLREEGFHKPHSSNKLVLTWFHLVPNDRRNKNIIEAQKYLCFIHTSCNKTKNDLVNLGVDEEKIIVIPLGVDLNLFNRVSLEEKQELRKTLSIPKDEIVIGSFQKDGVGWGKGLEPKLIKGPDIFVETVEKLARKYPIFILLVGPSRGYVENELQKRNIPFKSIGYLRDFREMPKYYHALDLYLIASRIEGGPKQVLKAWASGVPVVSTRVGMIPDIAQDGENILLADIEDIENLTKKTSQIIEDKSMAFNLTENALEAVKSYSWETIAKRYYQEIYSKL